MKNKCILVTGCSGLLGTAVTKNLIKQGANVIATDINPQNLEKYFWEVFPESRKNIQLLSLDINNEKAVVDLFKNLHHLDGAINCTYPRNKQYGKSFFDVSLNSFNENVALHLGSAFLFTQQAAHYFTKHRTPFSLINVSSVYGVIPPRFDIYDNTTMTMPVEYAVIKSALLHLNKYVVNYICDSNFRINSISPGGIKDSQPENFQQAYKNHTHGKGMLDITDVLGAITFLLSDESKFITGQNIIIDDGFCL